MSKFELSSEVDSEKYFILNRSEIERRLDPFYYIPSIKKLEEQVKNKGSIPLRKFVEKISSGATPKTTLKEKYYADEDKGIPFLRVQNLSSTGFLKVENCKYINEETHNNYLKRSQVFGGDLLVKITGVGRMAVASIAPDGFIGNTNQHMVVIKTKDKKTSQIIASYLNSDIGEKIASRRATGGTRPALDYPALLSIPIIYDEKILDIYKNAIAIKQQKEQDAKELLHSIDKYLLDELGITLPEVDNSLEKRIFTTNFSEISGRLDAPSNQKNNLLISDKYNHIDFGKILDIDPRIEKIDNDTLCSFIPMEKISDEYAQADSSLNKYFSQSSGYTKFKNNDLLWSKITPCMENGKSAVVNDLKNEVGFGSTEYYIFRTKNDMANIFYIHAFFRLKVLRQNAKMHSSGIAGYQRVSKDFFYKLKIPLPSIEKQNKIAQHIQAIRDKAKQLQKEAKKALEDAKIEVEKLILGDC